MLGLKLLPLPLNNLHQNIVKRDTCSRRHLVRLLMRWVTFIWEKKCIYNNYKVSSIHQVSDGLKGHYVFPKW